MLVPISKTGRRNERIKYGIVHSSLANLQPGRPTKDDKLVLVSFRIAPDLYMKLEQQAKRDTDNAGAAMTATKVAQRLLVKSLKKL